MSCTLYEIDFTDKITKSDSGSFIFEIARSLSEIKRICWIAGGAVRDMWLDREPNDYDLVTDATHEEILKLFPNTILVGQKFGVYKIPFNNNDKNIVIDLAVFREEDEYLDGRRPQIIKRSTPQADALRRDFTINALFYNIESHEIVDFVDGVSDLKTKTIKCVGDAKRRFQEDHLRVLRMARLSAQLGFEPLGKDLVTAIDLVHLICTVSGERIYDEVLKVVKAQREKKFWTSELTQKIFNSLGLNIDCNNIEKTSLLHQTALKSVQKLVMTFMTLTQFDSQTLDFLKTKLKCSRQDLVLGQKSFDYFVYFKDQINQHENMALELALMIDEERDKALVLQVLDFFERARILSIPDMTAVKTYLDDNPQGLLSGKDLVGKCDPIKITGYLKRIRRAQFEKKIRTSDEALIFLKSLLTVVN